MPVTATSLVDRLVAGSGVEVRRTQASVAALTKAATEAGTIFAGEMGGGFIFPSFLPAYDAMASLCHLLQLLAPVDRPLSALVDDLPRPALVHREVHCPWALKGTVMRLLTERLKERETDLQDGIKVLSEGGWSQVIPDPDEPVVHVYAEGATGRGGRPIRSRADGPRRGDPRGRDAPHSRETLKWRLKDRRAPALLEGHCPSGLNWRRVGTPSRPCRALRCGAA